MNIPVRRTGLFYPCVNFLRASSTLKTLKGSNEDNETTTSKPSQNGLSGEEARQFYETLITEPSQKKTDYQLLNGDTSKNKQTKSSVIVRDCRIIKDKEMSNEDVKKSSSLKFASDSRKVNLFLKMAQEGNIGGIRGLLRGDGMDINATDQFGWTALMCASHNGQKTCVKFLLKAGARVDLRNNKGQTVIDIARNCGLHDVFCKHRRRKKHPSESEFLSGENSVERTCEVCQSKFTGTIQEHNSSTAHLFRCQYKSERTLYHIPEDNIGFQLMKKNGWNQERGLGPEGTGRKFPVKTILKQDRLGLGSKQNDKARITHFSPKDIAAVNTKKKPHEYPRVPRRTSKRKRIQDQIKERKWEHDMRVYMNT